MGSASGGTTGSGYWRVNVYWSGGDSGNPATWNITVSVYRYAVKKDTTGYDARKDTTTVSIDGASASGTPTWNHSSSQGQERYLWGWTRTVNRSTSARSVYVAGSNYHPSGTMKGTSSAGGYETVPALPSYSITYYANGGTGTIANATKYYGINLALSDGASFTRNNYTLVGWNTAADGSGTHYDLSGTYTGNAALTLYAEWVLNAVTLKTKINDTWVDGILYMKINGNWEIPHTGYIKVNNEWKQIIT